MDKNTDPGRSAPTRSSLPTHVMLGAIIAFLVTAALAGYSLWESRDTVRRQAADNVENLSRVLERYVFSAIHETDLALQLSAEHYRHMGGHMGGHVDGHTAGHERSFDAAAYTESLTTLSQRLPQVLSIHVANVEGLLKYGAGVDPARPVNVADREHFQVARDRGFAVTKPVLARITQQWVLPVARRLESADGSFDGVVLANIRVEHFSKLFGSLQGGSHSAVILFDANTNIFIRHPEPKGPGTAIGLKIGSPEFKALWQQGLKSATYKARSTTDGVWRTYSYRQVGDYPLFIMVGVAEEDYLTPWTVQAVITAVFLIVLGLLLALLSRSVRQSLETQRQAYQYARSLLEASLDPLVTIDAAGKVTDVNTATEEVTGVDRASLVGSDFADYFSAPEKARAGYEQAFSQGSVTDYPLAIRHASGTLTEVLYNASVYRDDKGAVLGVFAAARDITERKKAETELAQYRRHLEDLVEQRTRELMLTEAKASLILESSADGLYGVDAQGLITFINPAGCATLGYRAEEVVGRSAHALFHYQKPDGTPYPVEACPSHNALRLGTEARIDGEVYWHADGHAVPVMYAIHPVMQDGKVTGAVTSFVNMSEQRAAAQAREQALVAAEKLVRVRSEFLANMSHEIRTPLNGVLGFANIGFRNSQDSEKARNAFGKILKSGHQLLGVINDILDFSKIEAGKLKIEATETCLFEVIEHALELVRERARAKDLVLRLDLAPDLPPGCISDPLRLGQILLNLLSNAIKFTETGRVTLSAVRKGNWLVFSVADTGIGMNGPQLGQLFNPFQQADGSTTRRFGGTGLGLAISKRILQLMGGDIQAESQPGIGSRFEFRLPYVPSEIPAGDAAPCPAGGRRGDEKPLAGLSILVAEDDAINQTIMEETLGEDGARVVVVGNGREAVDRVLQDGAQAFDIVLMDLQMPVMDGFAAARRILELAPGLPIIGQTAHAFKEEKDKCFAAGMVGHIAKPIDPDALVALLRQHVPAKSDV